MTATAEGLLAQLDAPMGAAASVDLSDAAAARVFERESSVPADPRSLRETPRIARRHLAGV